MEVEEQQSASSSVVTSTPSSINVSLHPLVVLNISDHFTRVRMQRQEDDNSPLQGKGCSKYGILYLDYPQPFICKIFLLIRLVVND